MDESPPRVAKPPSTIRFRIAAVPELGELLMRRGRLKENRHRPRSEKSGEGEEQPQAEAPPQVEATP